MQRDKADDGDGKRFGTPEPKPSFQTTPWTRLIVRLIVARVVAGAGMDVGGWLRSLGLGQYEAAFLNNAIGMDILNDLTESDLSQFGVLFGDRKRLLKAIAS